MVLIQIVNDGMYPLAEPPTGDSTGFRCGDPHCSIVLLPRTENGETAGQFLDYPRDDWHDNAIAGDQIVPECGSGSSNSNRWSWSHSAPLWCSTFIVIEWTAIRNVSSVRRNSGSSK